MPWHIKWNEDGIPRWGGGGLISDPAPAFGQGESLYKREAPEYEGTLYFIDPGTGIAGGPIDPWTVVKPLSYSVGSMEWIRLDETSLEITLHQTDGAVITHSTLLPKRIAPASMYRCTSPEGFVFIVWDTFESTAIPGVYFIALTELTGDPALGDGNQPVTTCLHTLMGTKQFYGSVLVGDVYYFLEHDGGYYPSGNPQLLFSNVNLTSGAYTAGGALPDGLYQGLTYNGTTFYVFSPSYGDHNLGALFSYDSALNTLTLLVESCISCGTQEGGLIVRTGVVGAYPLTFDLLGYFMPQPTPQFEESVGQPVSIEVLGETPEGFLGTFVHLRIIDPEYDMVSVTVDFSLDGVTWFPATVYDPVNYLPSSPTGADTFWVWDSDTDVPVRPDTADLRVTVVTPADSAGLTFTGSFSLESSGEEGGAPQPPPNPAEEDKINAASLEETPIAFEEASGGSELRAGQEVDVVLAGKGFTALNEFGDPRVRAVMLQNDVIQQVFDYTRFVLVEGEEQDFLNLKRIVIAAPGVYDVYLLDKDGARIGVIPQAIEAI